MSGEAVKVAVRVRPFNSREKERESICCIEMTGGTTRIVNKDIPNDEGKTFTFDYSYWSHDGFEDDDGVLKRTNDKYATQQNVFDDLGRGVLSNAFEGYNCSLFAYGQTGSGKSYSMVGYGKNRGIVPITCDELFKSIDKASADVKYEVTFAMLEIYNEQVRDLLSKSNPKGGLNVRQNPKLGLFYVEKLKTIAVGSYEEIERRMEEGTANRTVASTQMNATSSRAHTVVTITFDQISKNSSGEETKKSSSINLVDLAGSERAESTGATGDRLKEGANINKSLSALGNVISALADQSMGKKKVMVPYRDSVLTKLLRNALGGNSKTIMIAALSPASINFDETLGTLRYADRAKKIKNKAVVNENPMEKLIRELREENERLKKSLTGELPPESGGGGQMTAEDLAKLEEQIKERLLANQHEMEGLDWDQKLKDAREEDSHTVVKKRHEHVPHLRNLNEDPMLSGVIFHIIENEQTTLVGRKDAEPAPNIVLTGLSIQKQHAEIDYQNKEVNIRPGSQGAKIKVNGTPLTGSRALAHKDRVLFGSNHLYVFMNPTKPEAPEGTPESVDWEFAQQEIAESSGFATMQAGMTKEQQRIQEQVLELLPMISEVNAVSEELNKYRMFELVLISGAAQDGKDKSAKVMVKVKNLLNKNEWLWERGQFINRRYMIQEMYQQFVDGDDSYKTIEQDKDPFFDPPQDILIGQSTAFLQSLSYGLDFDDKLVITDYKGQEEGCLYVNIAPCDAKGKPWGDDNFVDEPEELLNREFHVKVTLRSADIENSRFTKGVYVDYLFYNDEKPTKTKTLKGTLSPQFKESKVFKIAKITQEHLEYFETGSIYFSVFGSQVDALPSESLKKLTTKELRDMDGQIREQRAPLLRRNTNMALGGSVTADSHLRSELQTLQKKFDYLQKKEKRMQEICTEWSNKGERDQDFAALLRAVHAVAFSSGNKLKSRVKLVQGKDSDTFSIYSFELTPDMKIIQEPGEAAILEEDENSHGSGSRPGSSTKLDKKDAKKSSGKLKNGDKSQADMLKSGASRQLTNGSKSNGTSQPTATNAIVDKNGKETNKSSACNVM